MRKPVQEIVKKGREQGFVTQDDILEVFYDAEERLDELDSLYETFKYLKFWINHKGRSFFIVERT